MSPLKNRFLDIIKDLIFSVIQCYYCHYYCYLRALWNADDFKCKVLVMSLLRYDFFVFMTFANHTLFVKFFCQHPKYIQKRKRNVIFFDFLFNDFMSLSLYQTYKNATKKNILTIYKTTTKTYCRKFPHFHFYAIFSVIFPFLP